MILPLVPQPPADAIVVDARGEWCPWPLLRSKTALRALLAQQRIAVYATDPLAELDLRALCLREGHELIELSQLEAGIYALIAKA
jgi:tRNA 2-thiouridine synthesizing protein A